MDAASVPANVCNIYLNNLSIRESVCKRLDCSVIGLRRAKTRQNHTTIGDVTVYVGCGRVIVLDIKLPGLVDDRHLNLVPIRIGLTAQSLDIRATHLLVGIAVVGIVFDVLGLGQKRSIDS